MREDTIAAIATAAGEGGIGIVRISGENAIEILKKIFEPASKSIKKLMQSYDQAGSVTGRSGYRYYKG